LFQKDYWEREALEKRRPPSHPVVRHYALSKVREIREIIRLQPGQKLLDLGCGNGFFSQPFSEICRTVGVDYSIRMLQANPLAQKAAMDANRLAFQDMAFDVVFCHALLHHVEDPGKVLSEMRRVSRKYVVVMEPNRANPLMWLFSALVPEERAALKFSLGYLKGLLEQNRLKVAGAFSHGCTVPNKTPALFLPFLKPLDIRHPWGMTNILIGER
jgi:SAM-dependent methyltransferase